MTPSAGAMSAMSLRRRRAVPRHVLLAAAAAAAAVLSSGGAGLVAFSLGFFGARSPTSARSQALRVARAAGTEVDAPLLAEATIYTPMVDPFSGALDCENIPEEMGVYAVYDDQSRLQYIGLSRDISKSIEAHAKTVGDPLAARIIASVKVAEMPGARKELLKEVWESWIKEHIDKGGEIPPGNLPDGSPGSDGRWRSRGTTAAKAALNLGGVAGITGLSEAVEAVRKTVEGYPVVIFMKGTPAAPQCGFSARSIGLLRETGIDFEAVNVLDMDQNPGVREGVKEYSKWPTIPQLFVKGQLIGGADILVELATTGQLKKELQKAVDGAAAEAGSENAAASEAAANFQGQVDLINDARRPTATKLCDALNTNFRLMDLRVTDQSAAHEGDAGALEMGLSGESHFLVELVAPEFEGRTPVQRQQMVFDALSAVMPRIHALSLVTKTPSEAA